MARRLTAEFIGTAVLVFIGVGVATLVFGFHVFGFRTASSVAAGVLTVGMAFGLILLALVYVLGPVSACHVNPAVTLGAFLTRRIGAGEAAAYWAAQFAGGIAGALLLWAVLNTSPYYSTRREGLGTNGWGPDSFLHVSAGGAFLTEVVLTGIFVFVVLTVSKAGENKAVAGIPIGLTLTAMHVFGIAIDGTSVNPARSLGPALITGGRPLSQVWLFLVAPLAGAVLAAGLQLLLHPAAPEPVEEMAATDDRAGAGH
ncbi:MAG TPA: aquaporin [Streptosporangiaceae bacterium]|jgi:aquaporin Z